MSQAAAKVLAMLDKQLSASSRRPTQLYIYPKQHAAVVRSRRKHKSSPALSPENLAFTLYRGIRVKVIESEI